MKLEFFDRYVKDAQISNFMQTCSVAAELFHADGQTDNKVNRRFFQFCKCTQKWLGWHFSRQLGHRE
jgi:hypothetical protein